MNPVYTDLHIHTSDNADNLDYDYDVDLLVSNVKRFSGAEQILISLTDHNVINKMAYEKLLNSTVHVLLGTELHIQNYKEKSPYHCHIFFDIPNAEILASIDKINEILNKLYPTKMITPSEKAPYLEAIVKAFDDFDFILLPHGGQSHRTFDTTIPDGVKFDTVIERNIYYNQFDGFTSRSNTGLQTTKEYFDKLGISSFVNLITCSDNYNPANYPKTKAKQAEQFIPTWMLSEPTFSGVRLALSESSRLIYQKDIPKTNTDYIKSVKLKNDFIDIDINLTQGLNVIIGGSSSGKTLLLDSLHKKIYNSFEDEGTLYSKFGVEQMKVDNPAGYKPHYISQNYITKVIDAKYDEGIEKIDIIKNTFKGNKELDDKVNNSLIQFKDTLTELVNAVEEIESSVKKLENIPAFPRLIIKDVLKKSPFTAIKPQAKFIENIEITDVELENYNKYLDEILQKSKQNPFLPDLEKEINFIKNSLQTAKTKMILSSDIEKIIDDYQKEFDREISKDNAEDLNKTKQQDSMLSYIDIYIKNTEIFKKKLNDISKFSIDYQTKPIESQGHKLHIENKFKLNKDIILTTINKFLKSKYNISTFDEITYENLFSSKFSSKSPKIDGYNSFIDKVYDSISNLNKKNYKIITKDGKDLDELSPGWRTAIILDVVLGYDQDTAPIFIDQPEDNLATNYINSGLVTAIKKCKSNKQIIIVSHSATIPMLADAQNIIYCKNEDGTIIIRSNPMEGKIFNKNVIDHIVEITDGGKPSVKKRVKKYNLKKYREEI